MLSAITGLLKHLTVLIVIGFGLWYLQRSLPPQHNPFAPVDLTEPVGFATSQKLARLKSDTALCYDKLDEAGVEYTRLPPDAGTERCPLGEAMVLQRSLTPYTAAPLRMTCHEMAATHVWERQFVRPLAEEVLGSPVARIETYGTFSCRTIAGSSRMSQHAYGNAIDIAGFVLEDGRRISVREHWREDGARGIFLERVHEGACKLYSVTLGPDYNAAHADHFHLDQGPARICR